MSWMRPWKRGDTFVATCIYLPDGVTAQAIDSTLTIASSVRTSNGSYPLTVTPHPDQVGYKGVFTVQGDTSRWGLGKAAWDITYTQNGVIATTNTNTFEVELGASTCLPLP